MHFLIFRFNIVDKQIIIYLSRYRSKSYASVVLDDSEVILSDYIYIYEGEDANWYIHIYIYSPAEWPTFEIAVEQVLVAVSE